MTRPMIAKSKQTLLGAGLLGATLITACSLSIPSEETLFGAAGGGGAGAMSGATAEGGAPDDGNGGRTEGGAGTNAGGKHQGGMGGRPEPTGGAANAGEAGEATGPEAGAGGEPSIVLPPAILLIRYDFDDLTQLTAKDVSGNGNDGVLAGTGGLPIAAQGHINGALKCDGALKQYVQLPNDILDGRQGISVAAWLYLEQATAWDRLFDFNSGESNWFYFSPTGWNPNTMSFGSRVAARTPSALAPEITMAETVSIKTWHHIAVVFAQPFLRYYLDGELKSERDGLSFGPGGLGKTNQNWIGRSVYAADPYLTGMVDDFRVYTGALTAEQVSTLAAQ